MHRLKPAILLALICPSLASCNFFVVNEQKPGDETVCENLSHARYCFDRADAFNNNDSGFLLRLDVESDDHDCNLSREGWPRLYVLFGDFRMPDKVYPIRSEMADGVERRVLDPKDHYFSQSEYEIETCKYSTVLSGTSCQLDSSWNGMRLKIRYWQGCGTLNYDLAKEVEAFIEGGRIATSN